MVTERRGINEKNRGFLEKLHRNAKGPLDADSAAAILSVEPARASRFLAYLASRGWLARLRRGLYALVPLGATSPSEWREDPWVVASSAFAPCYVGGWSACEHWHLTEQVFRDIVVFTRSPVRRSVVTVQGTAFRVKSVPADKHFGLSAVWRGQTKVQVSDPTRTIVDILDEPKLGGGIRHVAAVMKAYFGSEHRDENRLLKYAERLGNKAIFKRLGYLAEAIGLGTHSLISSCLARKSKGLSRLDPAVEYAGRIAKRWGLRVNVEVESEDKNR